MPDPRKARDKRQAWRLILTLLGAALLSRQRRVRAIGQWVDEHAEELRALRAVDVAALEARLADFAPALPAPAPPAAAAPWRGQALDGKVVRGAQAHGAKVHLVSLARHADGVVIGREAVAAKSNEITAAPRLLARPGAPRALAGTVTTPDALLAQRAIAGQIRAQGGHSPMAVKANQPELLAAIAERFATQPPPLAADYAETYTTTEKGHGRLERRTLERRAALSTRLDWPGAGQVLRRTYRAVELRTGKVSEAAGPTSPTPCATTAPLRTAPSACSARGRDTAPLRAAWRPSCRAATQAGLDPARAKGLPDPASRPAGCPPGVGFVVPEASSGAASGAGPLAVNDDFGHPTPYGGVKGAATS